MEDEILIFHLVLIIIFSNISLWACHGIMETSAIWICYFGREWGVSLRKLATPKNEVVQITEEIFSTQILSDFVCRRGEANY